MPSRTHREITIVILSVVAGSRSETATQSKDPYAPTEIQAPLKGILLTSSKTPENKGNFATGPSTRSRKLPSPRLPDREIENGIDMRAYRIDVNHPVILERTLSFL